MTRSTINGSDLVIYTPAGDGSCWRKGLRWTTGGQPCVMLHQETLAALGAMGEDPPVSMER